MITVCTYTHTALATYTSIYCTTNLLIWSMSSWSWICMRPWNLCRWWLLLIILLRILLHYTPNSLNSSARPYESTKQVKFQIGCSVQAILALRQQFNISPGSIVSNVTSHLPNAITMHILTAWLLEWYLYTEIHTVVLHD